MTKKSLLKTCKALTRPDHARKLIELLKPELKAEVRLSIKHLQSALAATYWIVKAYLFFEQHAWAELQDLAKKDDGKLPEQYLESLLRPIGPWCSRPLAVASIREGITEKEFVSLHAEKYLADRTPKKQLTILERSPVELPAKDEPISIEERLVRTEAAATSWREEALALRQEVKRLKTLLHNSTRKLDLLIKQIRRDEREAG